MEVSGDLEESVGKKVFAQANRLQQLHKTMRSYVVQDIDGEIGGIDYQIGARRADVEHQQRAATGQESAFKDRGAKVSLETAHFMHKVGSNLNGFAQRHSDAVNVGKVGLAAVSMLHPVSTAIFLGKYVFLSSPSVQTGMKNIFNSALEKVGTDSYTREYLSECAAEAAALHGSGISYAQLGKKIGGATRTTLNLAEKTVIRVKEVSPITFQYEAGRLNSGIPVDAVKLRNPFAQSSIGHANRLKTSDLTPTHAPKYGANKLKKFVDKIEVEGIKETIKIIEHEWVKYVVDGHHRLYAARILKLDSVP